MRVLEAAEQLAFRPNALARGLIEGRTGTVGLITSDLEGPFSIPVLTGAEDALGAGTVAVLLCDARGDAKREQQHVDALLSRQVDGLIVVGADTNPRPSLGTNLPVPVVYAYAPSTDPMDVSVTADNAGAAAMAIDHLLACGRRNVAHISGDRAHKSAQDRAQGATAALAAAGASLVGDGALFGSWNEVWGRGAARMLVERHPDIDGILCGSDQIARGVLDALREMGKNVPADIAVVGLDNWEVLASNARPGLTSVDMNLHRIGAAAAKSLVNAIDGTPPRGGQTVPCRLVVRGSTAPHD